MFYGIHSASSPHCYNAWMNNSNTNGIAMLECTMPSLVHSRPSVIFREYIFCTTIALARVLLFVHGLLWFFRFHGATCPILHRQNTSLQTEPEQQAPLHNRNRSIHEYCNRPPTTALLPPRKYRYSHSIQYSHSIRKYRYNHINPLTTVASSAHATSPSASATSHAPSPTRSWYPFINMYC